VSDNAEQRDGLHLRIAQLEAALANCGAQLARLRASQGVVAGLLGSLPVLIYRTADAPAAPLELLGGDCEQLTGYTAAELARKRLAYADLIHPDDRQRVFTHAQAAIQRRVPFHLIYRIVTRAGEQKWVCEHACVVARPEGALPVVEGVIIDATPLIRTQAALRESEERFRHLVEQTPNMVGIALNELVAFVNPAGVRLLGAQSAHQIIGRPVLDFVHPAFRETTAALMRGLIGNGTVIAGQEQTWLRLDGTPVEVVASAWPFVSEGRPAVQIVAIDITERKRTEEALRQHVAELDRLQATTLDITMPHELPALLETIVARAAQLLGAAAGALYLCDPDRRQVRCVVSYNTPRDFRGTVLNYGEGAAGIVAETGQPLIVDDYRVWPGRAAAYDRDEPFRAVLSAPMIWHDRVTGVIHVLHTTEGRRFTGADQKLLSLFAAHAAVAVENTRLHEQAQAEIAERMRAEELEHQLQEQQAQTERMEAVGRLATSVAHYFNNALTGMIGYAELMQMRLPPDDPLHGYATNILSSGHAAARIVHRLLAFSRKQMVFPKIVDLNRLLADMAPALEDITGPLIALDILLEPGLWPVRIDPEQVQDILAELAANAREAMADSGRLTIRTHNLVLQEGDLAAHVDVPPGEYVLLAVADTGCGMSPEVQAHLFEPFFTTRPFGAAAGLGLPAVYGIVKQNDGHITVHSQVGTGATVTIYLPRVQEPAQSLPRCDCPG
jgi:PAS domain S-box-containing protein